MLSVNANRNTVTTFGPTTITANRSESQESSPLASLARSLSTDSFEAAPLTSTSRRCAPPPSDTCGGQQGDAMQQLLGTVMQLVQSLLSLFGRLGGQDSNCQPPPSCEPSSDASAPGSSPSPSDSGSPSGVSDPSSVSDSPSNPSAGKKVYVFGNREYPVSTAKSAAKEVDLSVSMAKEFGNDEIFQKLSPEAKQVSENYGSMFGKSVVVDEAGQLVGIYDTKELEAANSDYALYGTHTAQGKTLKTPDGKSFEIADNRFASPLTFDLNGNGKVGTTNLSGGRNFQMAPGASRSAWAEAGDGILAFGNGKDATELFGNNTKVDGKSFSNGFEALKALATKHLGADRVAKGYLDKADLTELEKKANLHMKVAGEKPGQDKNARPVEDLGIERINLSYREAGANADAAGNQHRQVGTGFVQNGQTKRVDDVWYRVA
jgi:hypothetical protein